MFWLPLPKFLHTGLMYVFVVRIRSGHVGPELRTNILKMQFRNIYDLPASTCIPDRTKQTKTFPPEPVPILVYTNKLEYKLFQLISID